MTFIYLLCSLFIPLELAYFIPTIVATYGYGPVEAQLHFVIPWAAAILFGMGIAFLSDKLRNSSALIAAGLCVAVIRNLVLFTVHRRHGAEFAGLVLYAMGIISILPMIVC